MGRHSLRAQKHPRKRLTGGDLVKIIPREGEVGGALHDLSQCALSFIICTHLSGPLKTNYHTLPFLLGYPDSMGDHSA